MSITGHQKRYMGLPVLRHLCQLGRGLLLCPQPCSRVQLLWQLCAGLSVHNDELAVCKRAKVQLCIGLLYVLHCM